MPVKRQIYQTCIGLLIEQPFFGILLSDLKKEVDPAFTKSVAIRYEEPVFVLTVNPAYWQNTLRKEEERMGVLLRQVLHLFFSHPWRARDLPDRFLLDVAADLQANQYIPAAWLPENAVLLSDLTDFPCKGEQSVFYYCDQMEALRADEGRQYPLAFRKWTEWYEQRESLFDSHNAWYDRSPAKRVEEELARWSARSLVRQAAVAAGEKVTGNLPASLRLGLEEERREREPSVHWRKLLRQFAQSSRKTVLAETIHRPSKRYGVHPGIRVKRRQRLLVAVDTSGSVSREERSAFFGELRFLARTGAEITLLEFDAAVQQISKYKGRQPDFVLGGGGTSFLPPLEYANKNGPWDGVILFTDGFAPTPRIGVRSPVLWAITSRGLSPATPMYQALPGLKFKLRSL